MKKILVIDDDPRLLKAYSVKLSSEGFEVITETNGSRAFDTVVDQRPDVILLDGLLPNKNGWEILEDLKADSDLAKIPVIMVSNIGSEDREIEAQAKGAVDYLVKSNTPLTDLVAKINSII